MLPTVVERNQWTDSTMPVRMYSIDPGGEDKAVRLVYSMGSNESWGVQMTDWDDAPALADKSLTRRIKGRIYDLHYDGPKLHMVVLRTPTASYWVIQKHAALHPCLFERDDARDRQGLEAAGESEVGPCA